MTMLFMITPNNITNYMSVIQKYQQQQSQYRHSRGNLILFPTSVAVACAAIRFAEVFVVEVGYNRGKQRCDEEQHRAHDVPELLEQMQQAEPGHRDAVVDAGHCRP